MKSLIFDHKTQIYVNDEEGLKLDHKFNNINIIEDGINLNLKDNYTKLNLGDAESDQQAILGTNFMNWFDELVSNLIGEKGGPYLGNLGAPVVPNPEFIRLMLKYRAIRDPKFLSNNVYITSNFKISTVSNEASERPNDAKLGDNYKSTSKLSSPAESTDIVDSDYTPKIDPNNDANINNDPEDTTPKTKPEYIDPEQGSSSGIVSDFAKEMVRIAQTQVGVVEKPTNSNSGPEVEGVYQRSTWLNGTGWAWCAAFICYLFKTAASKNGIQYSFKLPKTAGAFDFKNWAQANSKYVEIINPPFDKILPGDIIIFNFSHIGISISTSSGGSIDTIEGNTDAAGSREGGGVFKKTRKFKLIQHVLRIKYNTKLVKPV